MFKRPTKTTSESLKKSIKDIRISYGECVDIKHKDNFTIAFSRVGKRYRIDNAPIAPNDSIAARLENSFNSFMENLTIHYSGVKVEGSMILNTKTDIFFVGYNDFVPQKGVTVKKGYSIDGIL